MRELKLRRGAARCAPWLVAGALAIAGALAAQQAPRPPETRTDNVVDDYHGTKVTDPYRWLEDQQGPATRAWIDQQNRYTREVLDALPGRAAIERRLTELMKIDAFGLPTERGGRVFYSKRLASQDLSVLYERSLTGATERVLMDPHPLSKDHTTSVNFEAISQDGKLVAYGIRRGGADEVAVHLMDPDTGKELPDNLPVADYLSMAIAPDNRGVYYSLIKKEGPRAYFHRLGTAAAEDQEVFGQGLGPEMLVGVSVSEDGRDVLFHVFHGSAADYSEIYFRDLTANGPVTPLVKGLAAQFTAEVVNGRAYLETNWKAPKRRILAADLKNPAPENWREVVPEGSAVLEGARLAGGKLLLRSVVDASSRLRLYDLDGKMLREIALPTLGTVSGVSARWDSPDVFFAFQSFALPQAVYHLDLASGAETVWAKPAVPLDTAALETEQVRYASKDGTEIPMFLVHRKGVARDGARPVLLTGYGGFNVSETPTFSAYAVLYAERGGVYAFPSLRGGGEYGEEWHRAGMKEKKQNVFDDFNGAAAWLISQHYTQAAKLSIRGQSNGGLLVGAALTERPDLYGAVVCRYPLEDMLRYQNFLVAKFWVPEYGSSEDAAQFPYLYAYSPYQNVKPGTKYPAVLFVTGDGDTRVAPLHARKMAARLQAATTSGKPVLLLYDTQSGHSGGRPLGKLIEEATDEMVFLFGELGVSGAP